MDGKLIHLNGQLAEQGIASPESFQGDGPIDLPQAYWGEVMGGFGQIHFMQGFSEIYNPGTGFRETLFQETINGPIDP